MTPVKIPLDQFKERLSAIARADRKVLVIKLVDIFDFEGSMVSDFDKVIGHHNPIILVANKVDLLPEKASFERIKDWVRREIRRLNMEVKDVFLVSSATGAGISDLTDALGKRFQNIKDIFVMGCSNSGKSTFINHLIQKYRLQNQQLKTVTSPIPGTTMSIITVPLPNGSYLYDTPGIHSAHQVINLLLPEEIKLILPKKQIESQVYRYTTVNEKFTLVRMKLGKTIFLGGLVRIDFLEGPELSYFTFFVAKYVQLNDRH